MEALVFYLLKASAILALFHFMYQALLRRETLFRLNRFFLLSGLLAATLLPLVTIRQTVVLPYGSQSTATAELPLALAGETPQGIPWEALALMAYLLGVAICTLVLLRQLWKLKRLIGSGSAIRRDGFVYLPSTEIDAPFSFFRYVFYNPDRHGESELPLILEHERAHGSQYHSVDILMGRLVAALLWINPLSWWYQKSVAQNLEYLADARAVLSIDSVRDYQYTLLRVSGNTLTPALANAFYSSLIKKRIIMLQQTQSKSIHMVKHLLILPALAAFLMAFNTETVYMLEDTPADFLEASDNKTVNLTIDKNTTEKELSEMKAKLGQDQIDFSYTTVRNDAGEIIQISLNLKGKNSAGKPFSGSYESGGDTPIEPILVQFDDTRNRVVFTSAKSGSSDLHFHSGQATQTLWVETEDENEGDDVRKKIVVRSLGEDSGNVMVWNSEGGENTRHIEIRQIDGDSLILANGKKMGTAEWEELGESGEKIHKIKVTKSLKNGENHVMIMRDSDDDEADIEVIEGGSGSFFFLDSGKGEKPLFYIDGKKASEQEVKALQPDAIEKIEVLKGDKATEQYGKKAKDGVVLITTKK